MSMKLNIEGYLRQHLRNDQLGLKDDVVAYLVKCDKLMDEVVELKHAYNDIGDSRAALESLHKDFMALDTEPKV